MQAAVPEEREVAKFSLPLRFWIKNHSVVLLVDAPSSRSLDLAT